MSLLKEAMIDAGNRHSTENGDLAFKSTKSLVLDLFATGGAIRQLSDEDITLKIANALSEDFNLGLRTILYISDIRGGQGERKFFKLALNYIVGSNLYSSAVVEAVLKNVSVFGRWDYLFDYVDDRQYGRYVLSLIKDEIASGHLSLLYKWLPSLGTGKNKLALQFTDALGISKKQYRTMLSAAREEMRVVERLMTQHRWSEIDYSKLPSKASLLYRNAFKRHDEIRYEDFISKAVKGEVKINAGTLYPHELLSKVRHSNDNTVDALWKQLPNFIEDESRSVLPMIDTSGSMTWTPIDPKSKVYPIDVAIGFGIYLAERLKGPFKDFVLSFDTNPTPHQIKGNTLSEKYRNIANHSWMGGSTNIVRAFDFILDLAIKNNLTQADIPSSIVLFSDMQFNGNFSTNETSFEIIERKFKNAGYEMPQVVFWNVQARNVNHPVTKDKSGATLVSGFSPSTLKFVLGAALKTPYELMLDVIMQERYNILKDLPKVDSVK